MSFRVMIVIIALTFSSRGFASDSELPNSLISTNKKIPKDTAEINLYLDNALLTIESDLEMAQEYIQKAISLAEEINSEYHKGRAYLIRGSLFERDVKFNQALDDYKHALEIFEDINNPKSIAKAHTHLANCYEQIMLLPQSLNHHFKSLSINTELGNERSMAINYSNIGLVYFQLGDDSAAMSYLNKARVLDSINNRIEGLTAVFGNIGLIYHKNNNLDLAMEYFKYSLQLDNELDDPIGVSINMKNIGVVFAEKTEFDSAFKYIHMALKISEESNYKLGYIENLNAIAMVYFTMINDSVIRNHPNKSELLANKKRNFDSCYYYLNIVINEYKSINLMSNIAYAYKMLSEMMRISGRYEDALDYYVRYVHIKDSLDLSGKKVEIAKLESRLEHEHKIKMLTAEQETQKLHQYLLGSSIVFLLIVIVAIFLRFIEKKKLSEALELQKRIVEEKNEQILASITYASTIQNAILPWKSTLKLTFGDILILYKPKDIVSGDSYWFQEVDGIKFLAVVDCTGHGIPGAMLTVIAATALDDAVLGKRLSDTGQILTYINEKVTEVLNQRLVENSIRDGMEVALIAIHKDKMQFSGAGRPLYLKNGTMEIVKTDKRGIAGQAASDEFIFSSVEIARTDKMMLYLTTDGYADQMNISSKKFSSKKFVALLESISVKPIEEQLHILERELAAHQGERSQIDDITIVGVKV